MPTINVFSIKVSFPAAVLSGLPQVTSLVAVTSFHSLGLNLKMCGARPAQSALGSLDGVNRQAPVKPFQGVY